MTSRSEKYANYYKTLLTKKKTWKKKNNKYYDYVSLNSAKCKYISDQIQRK